MDATQAISDSILESDEEENKEENQRKRGRPLAKLCILKNPHLPETELPLFLGDNVLGRDPSICSLPLPASSVSKQHATICISVYKRRGCCSEVDMEALVWDLGSMNGTRKGRLKLTPNVRYALGEGDSLVLADIPCQYVSCGSDSVSSHDVMRIPGSRNSRVKTGLPDAVGDTDTVGKKCVNGGTKAKKTPDRGGCLSFEQTPTQPQGSLVPESDSDSEGERGGRGDRRQKTRVSDCDSHKSSPSSSTFLSPPDKIVPESEDESLIATPSSSSSNRHVSFSTEKTDVDVERQHLEKNTSPAFIENTEEDEERAARGGTTSKETGQDVKQKKNVSFTEEDESLVSTPGVSRGAIPALNMDSDTDVEGEEGEGIPAGHLSLNTSQQADQPPNTVLFHMDSDTDVDEDEDISDKAPKPVPSSNETAEPSRVASGIQPEGITTDSDTDVDDDKVAVSEAIITTKATSFQTDSASSRDFRLDSDTDVEEEDSKDESVGAPAVGGPSAAAALTESCTSEAAAADLDILSDSDTDMSEQEEPLLVVPQDVTNVSASSIKMSGSGVDTELEESRAGDGANPADLRGDSDTDVDDEKGEDQIPQLLRERSLGSPVPLLKNCSTPVQVSGAETSALRPAVLSCSDQGDEDYAEAETQYFVLQTRDPQTGADPNSASGLKSKADDRSSRGDSFQPGLSDSSHLQCQDGALDTESTQAFVSVEGGVNLEETQAFISAADRTAAENDSNLEATQVYEENKEPGKNSEVPEKDGCVNLAFEATQAYISEQDSDEDKRPNAAVTETADITDFSSTLATAETQPVLPSEEEGSLETNNPICSVQVKPKIQNETKENNPSEAALITETQPMCTSDDKESDDEDLSPQLEEEQTQPFTCSALSLAETQHMHVSVVETQPMVLDEDDDEHSMPLLPKRKAKQLRIEEEESQQLTSSAACTAETQPVVASEDDDDDDSMPGPRKRKARLLQLEDETQSLGNSVESQPLVTCEGGQSDEENFSPCPRKRKAKPLQVEEAQTQPLISSEGSGFSPQPEGRGEDEENDSEVFVLPRQRKAKRLHLEDEETQQLTNSELSTAETQPTLEDEGDATASPQIEETLRHDEEQAQPLTTAEVSAAETQLNEKSDSIPGPQKSTAKQHHPEEECSEPPKRQTRKERKTLTKTRGRRGKAKSEDDNSEEEVKQTGEGIITRQREDEEEKSRSVGKKSLKKGQKEGKLEGDMGVAKVRQEKEETKHEEMETDDGERQEEPGRRRRRGEKLQYEGKGKEEQGKLQMETAERIKPDLESLERDRMKEKQNLKKEIEKKEQKEKERLEENLETAKKEQKERLEREEQQEHQTRLETEKEAPEKQLRDKEEKQKVSARGRRSTRKTIAALCPEQNSAVSTSDDFPSSRTRSRSNSSNSISSERSASSVSTQESKGRGRGGKRSSETLQTPVIRSSRRRLTVAAAPTEPNSSCSFSSEISSCRSSQNRARGGRQHGSDCHDASSSETLHKNDTKGSSAQQAGTSRGQQRVNANESKPSVLNEDGQSCQEKRSLNEKSPLPKRNVRVRGQKAVSTENVEEPVAPSVSEGDGGRNKRNTRKSELETNTDMGTNKVSKEKGRVQKPAEEEGKGEQNDNIPAAVQVRRTGRSSSAQMKKNVKESLPEEELEDGDKKTVEAAEKKARGRTSVGQKNKNEELKESGTSASSTKLNAKEEASEPRTPTSNASRKRQASSDSSPLAKTPRSSSGSPAARGRLRAGSQAYKVLFTGVVDEKGERVLTRLGGSMAKGVLDMNCLVTDKVRRTVKFLCAVAKGIPVVTTDWLEKSGKAGSFLSPHAFLVKDPEQEKKFSFCLQDSLNTAQSQPLLQGYQIHVTKSVKPEPVHMKEIICCSGAVFLTKMPSSQKPRTVVITCEEDWRLCGPAVSASLPVVTAEFVLTGILQQKLDFETHALSPTANSQPAGDRGRSRRKT
ncbi:mediator of DNA damage checkpoint protein 1 isoform X2 [Kryptolebias marmoratus]|uniref:mediator of DNA damage checkpoint protein 1 isoform X2 n=1 Tax=Kryptolebias marmoratus TaxID=37003 RepID=UPI000D5306AE|nr:mediator of DNA damage checkpoint protein 1 isoform X2 [Kryptolebias marmoratus]